LTEQNSLSPNTHIFFNFQKVALLETFCCSSMLLIPNLGNNLKWIGNAILSQMILSINKFIRPQLVLAMAR